MNLVTRNTTYLLSHSSMVQKSGHNVAQLRSLLKVYEFEITSLTELGSYIKALERNFLYAFSDCWQNLVPQN